MMPPGGTAAVYAISALAILGVVARPWRLSESLWALAGAGALLLAGLLPWRDAAAAVAKGADVYMFLIGMMLLSTVAQREGVFDHLAAVCVRRAAGSRTRLFLLVYGVGVVVTVFMSNDATAVVLTPAVLAVCRKARARPLPYLMACALIANAASFVLPISNPANLVIFGSRMPALFDWVSRFALPSLLAIVATYAVLRALYRRELTGVVESDAEVHALSASGRLAAGGIALTAVALLLASAYALDLGLPTLLAACATTLAIAAAKREAPWPVLQHVSWSVLLLVAGLFVIVEAIERAGALKLLGDWMQRAAGGSEIAASAVIASTVALVCNLMNNLPAGLMAGSLVAGTAVSPLIQSAVAIGIDLGPNLSITGSLATILWLLAIRQGGEHVSAWAFLRVGVLAMPIALGAALGGLWLQRWVVG